MFVLGAPTVGDHDHCAAHPCADAQSRNTDGSSSQQGLVQVLGEGLVRTALWAVRSTGRWSGPGWPQGGGPLYLLRAVTTLPIPKLAPLRRTWSDCRDCRVG